MSFKERKLCHYCLASVKDFRRYDTRQRTEWISHQSSFAALKHSGAECPLCRWLWRASLRSLGSNTLEELHPDVYKEITDADQRPYSIPQTHDKDRASKRGSQLLMRCSISARLGWYAGLEAPTEVRTDLPNFMSARFELKISGDDSKWIIAFDANFEQLQPIEGEGRVGRHIVPLLKHWLDSCDTTHEACRSASNSMASTEWKPSRLVEITNLHKPRSGLRLREATCDDYEFDVRYIALSHRWASAKQLLLLKSNHNDLREAIPPDNLKTSILETSVLAARLGIQYLWIDTLCIIQDDAEDRTHEILQMDKTYSHSTLTIAASDASTDEEGCFLYEKPEVTIETCKVRLGDDQSRDIVHDFCHWPSWIHSLTAVQNSVLAQRAWVFQERLLSPRTLHCCKHQFHWECHTLEASEDQPEGSGDEKRYMLPLFKSLLSDQLQPSESQDLTEVKSEAQDGWRRIVEEYSRGHLTFQEDKLRALAGVCAVWQRIHPGDEYLFGMWGSTLMSDLCWYSARNEEVTPDQGQTVSAPPVAPSWSWASVSGRVVFHAGISLSTAAIEEKTLRLHGIERSSPDNSSASPASLGQSDCLAALHLRGHPIEAKCGGPRFQQGSTVISRQLIQIGEDVSTKTKDIGEDSGDFGSLGNDDLVFLDNRYDEPPVRIFCLPLVIEDGTYTLDVDEKVSWGLVLVPVEGKAGYFRRVGVFHSYCCGLFDTEAEDLYLI